MNFGIFNVNTHVRTSIGSGKVIAVTQNGWHTLEIGGKIYPKKFRTSELVEIFTPKSSKSPRSLVSRPSPVSRPRSPVSRPRSPVSRPRSPVSRPRSPVKRPISPVSPVSFHSLPSSCTKQTQKKYSLRPSPPYPANKCRGAILKGNDGNLYISSPDRNDVCKWKIYKN